MCSRQDVPCLDELALLLSGPLLVYTRARRRQPGSMASGN